MRGQHTHPPSKSPFQIAWYDPAPEQNANVDLLVWLCTCVHKNSIDKVFTI